MSLRSELEPRKESILGLDAVIVVGATGQTGQLYIQELSHIPGLTIHGITTPRSLHKASHLHPQVTTISTEISPEFMSQPNLVILATPNPIKAAFTPVADHLTPQTIILLPQNGVNVVDEVRQIMGQRPAQIIRAGLFTPVSLHEDGFGVDYDASRCRLGLANISASADAFDSTVKLFHAASFAVAECHDYQSMQWTKLVLNTIGSTAVITGMTPQETFEHPLFHQMEQNALRARLKTLKAMGIPLTDFPWVSQKTIKLLNHNPFIGSSRVRRIIATKIAQSRDNKKPAAARKIEGGESPAEALDYHKPFFIAALHHHIDNPVDEAIYLILDRHLNDPQFNLAQLSPSTRKRILIDQVWGNQ